ncbi:MAG: alanine--tRNA ligase, partial [Candidatus Omnitrophica bacterium]|nr:alanine--tRNA ligase [Candidatus Omnitrophota bacterium]
MKSAELRRRFLSFFEKRGHRVVPSDSLVPVKDPTLLFTGAGMNQFKEQFLGLRREMTRAASSQKCFRTGDVEQVGRTPAHLTFFEMLGNFSFGDYFKKEAILYAWEFMTKELSIPPEKLWASVYESDGEAALVWEKRVGLPKDRIVRFGAKENFWPSNAPADGPNGPCGPCSEIYYDYEKCLLGKACPDPDRCAPGCPCGRFVEVWNLVFTQYDRQPDGSLKDLPARNIDTGMGLERLTAVMQNKMSVFETDLFEPLGSQIKSLAQINQNHFAEKSMRIVADHLRAATFLAADGLKPSNVEAGYVMRRLIRRAVTHGRILGIEGYFVSELSETVID